MSPAPGVCRSTTRRKPERTVWPQWFPAAFGALVVLALGVPAAAQAPTDEQGEPPPPPSIFDFMNHEAADPHDLHPPARRFHDRWRRIWGALGMRYHLYPAQQTGPEDWPPQLYSGGMNYSIWRNPITGWPES